LDQHSEGQTFVQTSKIYDQTLNYNHNIHKPLYGKETILHVTICNLGSQHLL